MFHKAIRRRECLKLPLVSPLLLLLLLSPDSGMMPAVQAVKVRIITNVTSPDYIYPEINPESQFYISSIQQKPSLGIAISGGGWRAAALGYGWLRAMHLVSHRIEVVHLNFTASLLDTCQGTMACLSRRRCHIS